MTSIFETLLRSSPGNGVPLSIDMLRGSHNDGASKRLLDGMVRTSCSSSPVTDRLPAARPNQPPRLVFLLSTERSGSTLLSMTLGANNAVVAPPEMHLLAYSTYDLWRREYGEAAGSLHHVLNACGLDVDQATLDAIFRAKPAIDVYRWLLEGPLPSKRVLLDKTPKYARSADTLARLESLRPHYIWLVRHPLGVAASQLELRKERRQAKIGESSLSFWRSVRRIGRHVSRRKEVEAELSYWRFVNHNIEFFLAGVESSRHVRVNFETLVKRPGEVLSGLCHWLGLDFETGMLSPTKNLPAELGPKTGDPNIRRFHGIDAESADRWRKSIPPSWLDAATLTLARRWGV